MVFESPQVRCSCSVCVQLSQFSRASHSCSAILHIHSHITLQIAAHSSCAGVWVCIHVHSYMHILHVWVSACVCVTYYNIVYLLRYMYHCSTRNYKETNITQSKIINGLPRVQTLHWTIFLILAAYWYSILSYAWSQLHNKMVQKLEYILLHTLSFAVGELW